MGYKLKEAREKAKMTQQELEKVSGVCRSTISAMENGTERATSTKTLVKLARALGCAVEDIFFAESA